MIIDIKKYIYKKMYNRENNSITNTNYPALRNIYDFVSEYELGTNGYLTTEKSEVIFKEQIGGVEFSIKLADNKKYTYYLDKITSLNKKNTHHQLCFLNLNLNDRALCFTYHTKETGINILRIEDLIINNSDEYIKCSDPKHKFKSGDILVQILIKLVETNEAFSHINYIELQDNSMKRCYGIGIPLKYLRTITDGMPYYSKFGFKPKEKSDNITFIKNKEIFNKTPTLSGTSVNKIFSSVKVDSQKLYSHYKLHFFQYINSHTTVDIGKFIRKMISLDEEKNYSIENKKLTCELVAKIIKPLYKEFGFKEYNSDVWIKIIRI